jgi:circadian clock protein KaiC
MKSERISTGIGGLDTLLNGGYIRERSYVVTGDAGTGKTTACLQFLASSLASGEKAVYVTVDERPAEILESAAAFSWDLQPYIQSKSLAILDAAPYFEIRGGSATEQSVNPQKMVTDLGTYAKTLGATILIVDPLTPLTRPMDSKSPGQDHARSLIQLIKSHLNTTNLFTSHDTRPAGQESATGLEQFVASGVLVLKITEAHGRFERSITIKKMRHTHVGPGRYPFALVPNQGIVLVDQPAGVDDSSNSQPPRHADPLLFTSFEPEKNEES